MWSDNTQQGVSNYHMVPSPFVQSDVLFPLLCGTSLTTHFVLRWQGRRPGSPRLPHWWVCPRLCPLAAWRFSTWASQPLHYSFTPDDSLPTSSCKKTNRKKFLKFWNIYSDFDQNNEDLHLEKSTFTNVTPVSRKGLGKLSALQLQPGGQGYTLWIQAAWGQSQFWPLSGCRTFPCFSKTQR